jgi:hypothetical protein
MRCSSNFGDISHNGFLFLKTECHANSPLLSLFKIVMAITSGNNITPIFDGPKIHRLTIYTSRFLV